MLQILTEYITVAFILIVSMIHHDISLMAASYGRFETRRFLKWKDSVFTIKFHSIILIKLSIGLSGKNTTNDASPYWIHYSCIHFDCIYDAASRSSSSSTLEHVEWQLPVLPPLLLPPAVPPSTAGLAPPLMSGCATGRLTPWAWGFGHTRRYVRFDSSRSSQTPYKKHCSKARNSIKYSQLIYFSIL